MGVGVQPVIPDHHLALVGDVRGHPGDKLQIIHRLQLGGLPAPVVADLPLTVQEQEPLQGQHRPDHIFSDPLGLGPGLHPDPAVNIETRMAPGEDPSGPFGAEEPFADQKPEDPSRAKISASRESSNRGILWKIPARSTPPSVTRKCRWGWKLIRSPKGLSTNGYLQRKKEAPELSSPGPWRWSRRGPWLRG